MFDLVREINRLRPQDPQAAAALGAELQRLGGILGLLQEDPEAFLKGAVITTADAATEGLNDAAVDQLVAARVAARVAKDWAEADRIREDLKAQGVVLEDGPKGTSWRRV